MSAFDVAYVYMSVNALFMLCVYFGLCLLVQTWLFGPVATGEGKSPWRKKGRDGSKQDTNTERSPRVAFRKEKSRDHHDLA